MKIEHVAMYVNDLEAAKDFFIRYFDAQPNALYHNTKTHFKSYFLSFKEGARLEIMHRPNLSDNPKELQQTGFIHIAFNVGSEERVNEMTEQFEKEGLTILSHPRRTGDGYYESCILDLEGNQIEITA